MADPSELQLNSNIVARIRINQELQQLQALSRVPRFSTEPPETLRTFIDASSCIDPELRQELSALLG